MKEIFVIKTQYANFRITTDNDKLLSLDRTSDHITSPDKLNPLSKNIAGQLDEYFSGKRRSFNIQTEMNGTAFQKDIWNAMLQIQYGKTVSYSEIARISGHDKAVRAVGTAIKNNPLPIIVPCHRVIRKNGEIGNYNGGIEMKMFLLSIEQNGS